MTLLHVLAQVKDHITKLAKKGATPSSIGVTLRDSHGIAQVSLLPEHVRQDMCITRLWRVVNSAQLSRNGRSMSMCWTSTLHVTFSGCAYY